MDKVMGEGFILKRWIVSVDWASGATTTASVVAETRGKALADTWRSDAFSGSTFGEFLKYARCRRDRATPPRYGDQIMVLGKPAYFIENNRQYVRFSRPGCEVVSNAHPYDVEPEEYRPAAYRSSRPQVPHV